MKNYKKDLEDAKLFLQCLKFYGFNPKSDQKILEISGQPETSISRLIKNDAQPFLVSHLGTTDKRLKKVRVKGGLGHIKKGNIIYPNKPSDNEGRKLIWQDKHPYPTADKFDVIISRGITDNTFEAASMPQEKWFGFCADKDDPNNEFRVRRINNLLITIKDYGQTEYNLVQHSIESKVIYLITTREEQKVYNKHHKRGPQSECEFKRY